MKIKKGDTVLIISGKDRGKKGRVLRAFPDKARILVEGINIVKKHQKPKKTGEKGQVVQKPAAVDVSNAKIVCPKCSKPTRIGYKAAEGKKTRICKKCKKQI